LNRRKEKKEKRNQKERKLGLDIVKHIRFIKIPLLYFASQKTALRFTSLSLHLFFATSGLRLRFALRKIRSFSELRKKWDIVIAIALPFFPSNKQSNVLKEF
ncbi:MAG: hypothetical protein IKR34_01280, partial [Candidatus Gastranaerophilales bacterium]|nr:hypothetical protein [Candidatus Gastranaerophilales bacterium]